MNTGNFLGIKFKKSVSPLQILWEQLFDNKQQEKSTVM